MSTKEKTSEFDCYAKLADDEPYFVLRAKDPIAPYLIQVWRHIRAGDQRSAEDALLAAEVTWQEHIALGVRDPLPLHSFKSKESGKCAHDMQDWRTAQCRKA